MKISIVIPVYEMHGRGHEFLKRCIDSVYMQIQPLMNEGRADVCLYEDYEIIVTDNSENGGELRELVCSYGDDSLFYFKSNVCTATQNLNEGIQLATGRLVKIMFQDDLFLTNNCLIELVKAFRETGGEWFAFARKQIYDAGGMSPKILPRWNDKIISHASNTISAPSVIAFVNRFGRNILFGPYMDWVYDIDWYYQMYLRYGEPYIIGNAIIGIQEWTGQFTNSITKSKKEFEVEQLKARYKNVTL